MKARACRHLTWALLAALVFPAVVTVAAPALAADGRSVPLAREQITLSFAPLVKRATPAVVNIYTKKVVQSRVSPLLDDPFFRRFFGENLGGIPRQRVQNSLGSGVIVRADGLILTNHHVVKDSDEIIVALSDRREFPARIVLSDERTDLAALRIDARGEQLPALELRDSDDIEVGDLVVAIGNPFGVGQTVTSGIVSAVARTAAGVSDSSFFIQTDAAINPGNSGGALISMDGRLVGINTAIYSQSGGSIGIGFAIPSNMAKTFIDAALNGGKLVRPWLGASGQAVTPDLARGLNLPRPEGVLVNQVHPRGPAAAAGLRVGDVVVAVNNHPVDDAASLRFRLGTARIGGNADLTVMRRGQPQQVSLRLQPPPEDPPREPTLLRGRTPLSGATAININPAFADEAGFEGAAEGVLIAEIAPGAIAGRLGFQPGDQVLKINEREIKTVRDLTAALEQAPQRWVVTIKRGDQVITQPFGG